MRLLRVLAVFVGAIMSAQVVSMGPANAAITDLACRYDHVTFNACLDFEDVGQPGRLDAHVGLDVFMSQEYAQDLISHGADFRASLWADDTTDQFLADLSIAPGWPAAGAGRLGVEFVGVGVERDVLNEDEGEQDEVYAKISYFDYHRGKRMTFTAGVVRGEFAYLHPGGGHPQCLALC